MSLTAIIILISIGLVLIVFEFLVLPGTNISGIVGIIMIVAGIFYGYNDLGAPISHFILVGTLLLMIGMTVLILRSETWKSMALNATVSGTVENKDIHNISVGDQGKSMTRLASVGTVMVNNMTFEGKSGHLFIDPNTDIEVVKIIGNQLIVKPI